NNELQYYTASKANSYIKDDFLVIKAAQQNYKGKFYTSARLRTKGKADWTYGRYDIRAKTPVQQGVWPAIWMLPTDWVYGAWPQSGEIDIMESIGSKPTTLVGTLHYGDAWPNNKHTGTDYILKEGDLSTQFHLFSVEWEPNVIRWYIDDSLYATKTPKDLEPSKWPFDQKFHMILNLAIGGQWPGPPDETTTFPKYMFVDYVRVYQKK
ncbi:MAG TPA: glycoside hydrolase family 16 protein, partial [Cytophagaceae bacterium]|nr:glycoside hydrolase family 16 protein [Cytophagaceae bacterium]